MENPKVPETNDAPPPLSKTSKFNIWLMRRINRLAIAIFVVGVLTKIIYNLFFK